MSFALNRSYLRVVQFTETFMRLSEETMQQSPRQETTLPMVELDVWATG
jgi:hypothetical protein